MTFKLLAGAALAANVAFSADACSETTACELDAGEYFMKAPESASEGMMPAVVYIHGWGGTGSGVFRNTGMVNGFVDRGYVVAAPSGLTRTSGNGGYWAFRGSGNSERDEISFISSVREDLIANHNVDPDRVILAGFSIGGSMTAYLACADADAFSAYAPLGGNFWRPHPETCEGPVRMLHTHGWRDGTVPLEGRVLRGDDVNDLNAVVQGDIFYAMQIWREANGCNQLKADRYATEAGYMRRAWDRCTPGSALELAIFDGGHIVPNGWPGLVADWFEGL
ncbi:MAG: PHB depolymerase family esterase [Pseudomonadota bacterium]